MTTNLDSIDTSARSMRRNIWHGLLSATDQEIHEGMYFYDSANALCRMFASLSSNPKLTPGHIAGIYAALSPMNSWDTNVANILDLLRDWSAAPVNTSDVNLHKALRIRCGESPGRVLVGRKVTSFYLAIANPADSSQIPVDRHLINLALGVFPDKNTQSRLASDQSLYNKIESVYADLGRREGIGNRLSSIAWFVQRRIERSGQLPIPHPDSPICCGRAMHSHGKIDGKVKRRFCCPKCGKSRTPEVRKRAHPDLSRLAVDHPVKFALGVLNEAPIVYLPSGHPCLPSDLSRQQYLSRFIVMNATGERLRKDEHVHHSDGDKFNCRLSNLEVWLAERHGRFHANHQLLYMCRDLAGKFARSEVPPFRDQVEYAEGADDLSDIPF